MPRSLSSMLSLLLAVALGLLATAVPGAGPVTKRGGPAGTSGELAPLTAVTADRPSPTTCKPAVAKRPFTAQLLGPLDVPVGDGLDLRGQRIPARVTAQGGLELDLADNGRWRTVTPGATIPLQLRSPEVPGRTLAVRFSFAKDAEGKWTCRNTTPLELRVGKKEAYWVVDANANGRYNDVGVDGIAPAGAAMLWPLPAVDERWASDETDYVGIALGPWGEQARLQGRPLIELSGAALGILRATNRERLRLGLPPRPADARLSAALQRHCDYMARHGQLGHDEAQGAEGYSVEGAAAGARASISSRGSERFSAGQMENLYHRFPHILPHTVAFGVGANGRFCGIDARGALGQWQDQWGPVFCPAPGQEEVPVQFRPEVPDPMGGDTSAGFPITAVFGTGQLRIVAAVVREVKSGKAGEPLECATFAPGSDQLARNFMPTYRCGFVAMIPRDPLRRGATYEVTWELEVDGQPWTRTYRFST